MITECPHCKVELKPGIAIKDHGIERGMCWPLPPYNWDTLKIIDCVKCPQCGFSDDMKENYENI